MSDEKEEGEAGEDEDALAVAATAQPLPQPTAAAAEISPAAGELPPSPSSSPLSELMTPSIALSPAQIDTMTMKELQSALHQRGLPTKGKKTELVQALLAATAAAVGVAPTTLTDGGDGVDTDGAMPPPPSELSEPLDAEDDHAHDGKAFVFG